ncbi:ribokinase [Peterkaempfera sp. SMS 1(5)a]|uniref:ribokinase n=1 Tax=Peterkaempfera podocarpi TaxID=3232308 RepID=UPI0036709897
MTWGEPSAGVRPIVVFGSLNQDVRLASSRIARPGETIGDASMTLRWGGKGANQAVAAARLGGEVLLVSAVGDDSIGRAALADLDAEGVDRRHVRAVAEAPTGTAVVIVDAAGDNAITVAPGANAAVSADDLAAVLGEVPAGVLVTCFELPIDAVRTAVGHAAAAGWEVIVNPAPAADPLVGEWPDGCLFTPNAHELVALTGTTDVERAARQLAAQVNGTVVATLGAEGAVVVSNDRVEWVAAPRAAAVDTTGAGDTFNGALAWCRARGMDIVEAVRVAVVAASASTEHEGAREGMPTLEQLTARSDPGRPARAADGGGPS